VDDVNVYYDGRWMMFGPSCREVGTEATSSSEGGSVVLQVTEAAASVLRQAVGPPDVPGSAVRIQPVETPAGQPGISFQPVDSPNEGDAEGQAPGLDVFVAPELSDPLDEAVLDARQTQEGTELFLRPQAQPG
jgi:hypothetical protein